MFRGDDERYPFHALFLIARVLFERKGWYKIQREIKNFFNKREFSVHCPISSDKTGCIMNFFKHYERDENGKYAPAPFNYNLIILPVCKARQEKLMVKLMKKGHSYKDFVVYTPHEKFYKKEKEDIEYLRKEGVPCVSFKELENTLKGVIKERYEEMVV